MTVSAQAMRKFKNLNPISKADVHKVFEPGLRFIAETYEGATSSAGIAKMAKDMVDTAKAVVHNVQGPWTAGVAAGRAMVEIFGPNIDGKEGRLAELVEDIRSGVRNADGYSAE